MQLHRVRAQALVGNPLGDPVDREIAVWRPDHAQGPLPTVLALAAFTNSHYGFLNRGWRRESLIERTQRLIAAGMPPVQLVIPDVMTAVGGSQFLDSPGVGRYASWILDEVMPWAEGQLPVASWGAIGKSSGGYGALRLALSHPHRFGAIAAHAPDAGFEYAYPPDFPGAVEALRAAGGLDAWWADFRGRGDLRGPDHAVVNLLAMSCCYSPDPGAAPLPCALPVDLETGELVAAVFERWLAHDPVRLVQAAEHPYDGVAVWLDVGRRDEFRLQVGARMLARACRAKDVDLSYEEHAGGHFKLNARLDSGLRFLAARLST